MSTASASGDRYRTGTVLRRQLRVRYPLTGGKIVLRTDLDWDRDLEATSVTDDGTTFTFELEAQRPFIYFKPCWHIGGETRWAVGSNGLVLMTAQRSRDVYPYFTSPEKGSFTPVIEIDSPLLGRTHRLRAYLPAGYEENTLRKYPVLFMQDGKNLFFPEEAFLGRDWAVGSALDLLDGMNAVDKVVVIGIFSHDRMADYTKPGYELYARSVVSEILPKAIERLRLIGGPKETMVMGSSLGGVVSFYMAWQWPEVFGGAACLSSTFSHKDDLIDRVLTEPKSTSKFYVDSGWPGDNYEVTLAMGLALQSRGYVPRLDFLQLTFPFDGHDESAWGRRIHLPLQLFLGKVATAARGRGE